MPLPTEVVSFSTGGFCWVTARKPAHPRTALEHRGWQLGTALAPSPLKAQPRIAPARDTVTAVSSVSRKVVRIAYS